MLMSMSYGKGLIFLSTSREHPPKLNAMLRKQRQHSLHQRALGSPESNSNAGFSCKDQSENCAQVPKPPRLGGNSHTGFHMSRTWASSPSHWAPSSSEVNWIQLLPGRFRERLFRKSLKQTPMQWRCHWHGLYFCNDYKQLQLALWAFGHRSLKCSIRCSSYPSFSVLLPRLDQPYGTGFSSMVLNQYICHCFVCTQLDTLKVCETGIFDARKLKSMPIFFSE